MVSSAPKKLPFHRTKFYREYLDGSDDAFERYQDAQPQFHADGTEAFTRGLEVREWQVGIGAELPVKDAPVVPYLELAGVRRRVQAEVAIPEGMVSYSGRSFTFVAKGGVMVPLGEHVFLDVYGQTALRGQPGWNAGLSLGVAMF